MPVPDYNENVVYPFNKTLEDKAPPEPLQFGDGDGTSSDMNDRLSRLEGEFNGLRSNQAILMTAVGLVSAILLALGSYAIVQLNTINGRVNELPGRISTELRDMNRTLADVITASKKAPPQVILLQAPGQPAPQQKQ